MGSAACSCAAGLLAFARAAARGASRSGFACAFAVGRAGWLAFFCGGADGAAAVGASAVSCGTLIGHGYRSSSHACAPVNGRPANTPAPIITIAKVRSVSITSSCPQRWMAYTEPPQWRRIGVNGALFAQSEGGNVGGSEGRVISASLSVPENALPLRSRPPAKQKMMLEFRPRHACEILQFFFFASPSAHHKKCPGSGAAPGALSLG